MLRVYVKNNPAQNLAQTSAKISFVDGIPSMAPTEGNNKVLIVINSISMYMIAGAQRTPIFDQKSGIDDL